MYVVTHAAGVGVLVDGVTNANVSCNVNGTKQNISTFDLTHASNVGLTLVLSQSRSLVSPLANVIGSHILHSTVNGVMTIDLRVLQLSLSGGSTAYIGYATATTSVATISLIGHVAGAGALFGDVVARDLVCGNALLGCPT